MYRSGQTLRVLANDPNHIINERPNIRSIDEVLNRITTNSNIGRPVPVGATTSSAVQISAKKVKSNNAFKRQKTNYEPTLRVSQSGCHQIENTQSDDIRVFKVIYGTYKPNKKHKQFSSDGFLTVRTNDWSVRLYSIEGKGISTKVFKNGNQFESGNRLVIGSRELEIDEEVSPQEFKNKTYFVQNDD